MSSRESSRRQQLAEYLKARAPAVIDEDEWNRIATLLAPISPRYLRKVLGETGIRVTQPLAGVRQGDFEQLEQSLLEILEAYDQALGTGDRERARLCRKVVIQSKDHARLVSRNPRTNPARRAEKDEMVNWMLVWLENPEVFPEWVRLRKRVRGPYSPNPYAKDYSSSTELT